MVGKKRTGKPLAAVKEPGEGDSRLSLVIDTALAARCNMRPIEKIVKSAEFCPVHITTGHDNGLNIYFTQKILPDEAFINTISLCVSDIPKLIRAIAGVAGLTVEVKKKEGQ